MSASASARIRDFVALQPRQYPVLQRFAITQIGVGDLTVSIVAAAEDGRVLTLDFDGVVELTVDWPQWSLVKLDVIDITDISGRGMEGLTFRVHEGSGLFALSCRDFAATVK